MQTHAIGQPKEMLDTPVLVVDLDVMDRNVAKMARTIIDEAGVRWRPHTKALKSPEIARKLLDAGACGVTCAKLGEAEVMASGGIQGILVANQIVGPTKIARLVELRRRADVTVVVDSVENVRMMGEAAAAAGVTVPVLIEVDLGLARAGVAPGSDAVTLAERIAESRGVRFVGLMGWEAHVLRLDDPEEKRDAIHEALAKLVDTAEQCREHDLPVEIVSCGGTGTYWVTAFYRGVTEIQAGGGAYSDLLYRKSFGVDHEYAMTVLSTVTSRPTPDRIVCDAGHKTMSSGHMVPEAIGVPHVESIGLSAEHGTIRLLEPSGTPRVGDVIEFIVGYTDSTTVLHDAVYAVRDGIVESVWELTGRGRLQ